MKFQSGHPRIQPVARRQKQRVNRPGSAQADRPGPTPAHQRGATRPDRLDLYASLPLRLFLGLTFLYAGIQKLSDPGFLHPGSNTYIGTQLQSFALHSPIGFLLSGVAIPLGPLTGIGVIAVELGIGLLTLFGLYTRGAAVAGALVSFTLFLTATWDVQPYFLGSDSIYAVAWVSLALIGDRGVASLQRYLAGRTGRWPAATGGPVDPERRRLLVWLGGAAVALVWVLAVLPRGQSGRKVAAASTPQPSESPSTSPAQTPSPSSGTAPSGTRIGSLSQLRSNGGSVVYQDPKSGDPAVAIALQGNNVVAYDAVCTHAGCTVQYDAQNRVLACPCHGAVYDPARGAEVLQGPASQPLARLNVVLGSNGDIYAQ